MTVNKGPENFEKDTGAGKDNTPEPLNFTDVMRGQERVQKPADTQAAKAGGDFAYMSNAGFPQELASIRQMRSPELTKSIEAAVRVPSEQKAQGGDDPAEQAARIAAKQQEQIDNYAKSVAQKPQNEQVAEALKLAQYIEKMTTLLNKVQGA
jgi:hypothetical protein